MRDVFVCDAVRTPIGRVGGALAKDAPTICGRPDQSPDARIPSSTGRRSMRSISAAPNQAARTNRNGRGWRCCCRACRRHRFPASPSIARRLGLDAVGAAGRAIRAGEIDFAIGRRRRIDDAGRPFGDGQGAGSLFSRSADNLYDNHQSAGAFINPADERRQYGVTL